MEQGTTRLTRNGGTYSVFGHSIQIDLQEGFPLLQGRRLYPQGVFGEFAAIVRGPKCVLDFKRWGCNYWDQWADKNGKLTVDYGNAWHEHGQIEKLKEALANDPTSRRMIINAWRPERLDILSLPCCHYSYQFYVRDGKYLDMIWTQRSVDIMVGLPADVILASAWIISLANEFSLEPGRIKMDFGDCHIYEEHLVNTKHYVDQAHDTDDVPVIYNYLPKRGSDFCKFEPGHIALFNYNPQPAIKFELKL